jgi:predicted deacylase
MCVGANTKPDAATSHISMDGTKGTVSWNRDATDPRVSQTRSRSARCRRECGASAFDIKDDLALDTCGQFCTMQNREMQHIVRQRAAITIGGLHCEAGSLATGHLEVAWLEDSSPVRLPLLILNGRSDGPTLFVSAAMHGTEVVGIEVIRRLMREQLNPATVRGAVIACPILNPLSFGQHQPLTPRDGMNMIRTFPGDADGSTTQQISYAVNQQLLARADAVIDIHSNAWPSLEWVMTPAATSPVTQRCMTIAEATGLTVIDLSPATLGYSGMGTMLQACVDQDKPMIMVELTSNRYIEDRPARIGVRAVLNAMRRLEMLDGESEPQVDAKILPRVRSFHEIRCHKGGMFHRTREPGDAVKRGEIVGKVVSPLGDVLEEIPSSMDGYVLSYECWKGNAVQTGGFVVRVGGPTPIAA